MRHEVRADRVLVGAALRRVLARVHGHEALPAPGDRTVAVHIRDVGDRGLGPAPMRVDCVPHRLESVLRIGKRNRTADAGYAAAVVDQTCLTGIALHRLAHPVREAEIAMAGVHLHAEGLRIPPEQRLLAGGKRVAVLGRVARVDLEQGHLVRVRSGLVAVRLRLAGPGAEVAPGVFGHAAGTAGMLCTHAGLVLRGGTLGACGKTDHDGSDPD